MNIELFTDTGTSETGINEDYVAASLFDGYAMVLDGASNLTKKKLTPWGSDSAWFSYTLGTKLGETLRCKDKKLTDALYEAGCVTAEELNALASEAIARDDEPSAGVVLASWQNASDTQNMLEVATLGDCLAVVGFTDGATEVIYDERLSKLDKTVVNKISDLIHREGYSYKQAREAVSNDLMRNRLLRNRENGYAIADPSCEGYKHAIVKTFPIRKVKFVFLCSDGCYSAIRMGLAKDYSELAKVCAQGKGKKIMKRLRTIEHEDMEMYKYPRFKISDDATYALLDFEN